MGTVRNVGHPKFQHANLTIFVFGMTSQSTIFNLLQLKIEQDPKPGSQDTEEQKSTNNGASSPTNQSLVTRGIILKDP